MRKATLANNCGVNGEEEACSWPI